MRPVLLLVSLLISEMSLPGDETWVWNDFCRILCSKLLLSRLKSPSKDLELVLTKKEDACVCFRRKCVYVTEQLRLRRSSFHRGCSLHDRDTNQDTAGIIPNNQFPALATACRAEKCILVFLVKASSLTSVHHHFSGFLLEKIPDTYFLTKSCCTAATAIISYHTENGKIKSATKNKKASGQVVTEPQVSPTEKKTPAMHIKAPFVKVQRHAVRKTNKYLQQLSGKVAFKVTDRVYVQRPLLLLSRVNKGSRNISAQDDNTEYFRNKKTRKHAELRFLRGASKTDKNGNLKILVQQKQCVHKTNNEDVDEGHMLSDVEDEALIMLLLPQRKPLNERKPDLNPAVKPETVRIILKEVGDPPPIIKTIQDFITGADKSKCKSFRGRKLYKTDRTERMELKPPEKTENRDTDVNKANINTHNPAEDLFLPSPPSVKVIPAETTTYSTGSTHTTNTEAFSQNNPHGQPQRDQNQTTTSDPEPETETETSFTKGKTEDRQATPKIIFSGLRMREDIQEVMTKHHKDAENRDRASTNWVRTERKENQNEPGLKSPFKHSEAFREETMNYHLQTTGTTVPVCRGLIHRTESGWKHCMERLRRPPSTLVSTREAPDAREMENTPISNKNPFSDEDDHFYYFNGVLKKVQNHFYVYSKRLKRQLRSSGTTEGQNGDSEANLISYLQRLVKRNKISHF